MSGILKMYRRFIQKYPVGSQAAQAGILMALGDQIAQNVVEQRDFKHLDFKRTARFACIGFFIIGPSSRVWYGILDQYIGSKGGKVVLAKVILDQLVFAPIFIAILLITVGALQGKNIEGLKIKLNNDYWDILKNNYKIWPLVQIMNFYFVPLQYQVLVVQTVAIFWNTYVSYRTSSD